MTHAARQAAYVRRLRQRLLCEFGGKCEVCGTDAKLEFAHRSPTPIVGQGRGSSRRYLDVQRNRTHYRLLCKSCHTRYDTHNEGGS